MKLRNKKTGVIVDILGFYADYHDGNPKPVTFSFLSELTDEWEDYIPKYPFIKDEKVRKAVRAWAEAWSKNEVYKKADNALSTIDNFVIQFGQTAFIDLEEKQPYTIAELCGEEEE